MRSPDRLRSASRLAVAGACAGVLTLGGSAAAADGFGGPYRAGDGSTVTVLLSPAYGADEGLWRSWGEFLARLPHGPELSSAVLRVVPPDELAAACGGSEDGCYDPNQSTLVVPGSPPPDGQQPAAIAAHEYAHHIAANRSDAPWDAYDWGTKRWASYEDVCRRVAAGQARPGDEGAGYALNPGEAFADAYRVLAGGEWSGRFDPSFAPDASSLAALREDVLHPWTGGRASTLSGRVRGARRIGVPVSLDGTVSARLLAGSTRGISVAGPAGTFGRRARALACGQDSITLTVRGRGRFRLRVVTP